MNLVGLSNEHRFMDLWRLDCHNPFILQGQGGLVGYPVSRAPEVFRRSGENLHL